MKNILLENADFCHKPKKIVDPRKKDKPWFDSECRNTKSNLSILAKKITTSPEKQETRKRLFIEKRFKKMVTSKKRKQKHKFFTDLELKDRDGNQKEFWKTLRKISSKERSHHIQPSLGNLFEHFEKLSNST